MRRYESDFYGWAEDTARAICNGQWDQIDRALLADEVDDLKKRIESQIESRLRVLLTHLLKIRYQPGKHTRSWDLTIAEQRLRAQRIIRDNPSVKVVLGAIMAEAYATARIRAAKETGVDLDIFPVDMPFTDAEIWG